MKIYYLACRPVNTPGALESEFLPDKIESPTSNNIRAVNEIISRYNIDIILNEGGFGEVSKLFSHEFIPKNVKIISHLHFDPLRGRKGYYESLYLPLSFDKQGIKNLLTRFKSPYHRLKLLRSIKERFELMLKNSDSVVVLSPKHSDLLKIIVKSPYTNKIVPLINPLTFSSPNVKNIKKCNEIIYVGRLEYSQKRVDRILKTWQIIYKKHPDWNLTIVGDGNERNHLEDLSIKLGLERISFAGRTNPQPFYEKAKILLLTSNHEGTPMVIQEAMSYGVVPIVMDTFSALSDMITDGHDGIITKPFNIKIFAKAVESIIVNQHYWQILSSNAQETIRKYNNDIIFEKWDVLISQLSRI